MSITQTPQGKQTLEGSTTLYGDAIAGLVLVVLVAFLAYANWSYRQALVQLEYFRFALGKAVKSELTPDQRLTLVRMLVRTSMLDFAKTDIYTLPNHRQFRSAIERFYKANEYGSSKQVGEMSENEREDMITFLANDEPFLALCLRRTKFIKLLQWHLNYAKNVQVHSHENIWRGLESIPEYNLETDAVIDVQTAQALVRIARTHLTFRQRRAAAFAHF